MQLPQLIKAIDKVGPLQVRFTLNKPDATFLATLSMGFASIYSAEYAGQLMQAGTPEKLNAQPIGTGPFVFKRFQKDAAVRYVANPDYFAGKPKVDGLIFAITPTPTCACRSCAAANARSPSRPSRWMSRPRARMPASRCCRPRPS